MIIIPQKKDNDIQMKSIATTDINQNENEDKLITIDENNNHTIITSSTTSSNRIKDDDNVATISPSTTYNTISNQDMMAIIRMIHQL